MEQRERERVPDSRLMAAANSATSAAAENLRQLHMKQELDREKLFLQFQIERVLHIHCFKPSLITPLITLSDNWDLTFVICIHY